MTATTRFIIEKSCLSFNWDNKKISIDIFI